MEEAQTQDSVEEVVSPAADVQQETQQVAAEQAPQTEDSDWIKNLRRDRKEAIRRAEEAENKARMQEEVLQRILSQQAGYSTPTPPKEDVIAELAKQEFVAGEKVAQAFSVLQDRFEKKLEDVKQNYAVQKQQSLINDLRREYSDFDQVVNPETLAVLEETNPRLAKTIADGKDPYSMAVQSYEYIKAAGLANKLGGSRRAAETERKIEQNKKTVQSPQAFDKRPIAQAFQLTESMKKELQNEMYTFANQAGMGY